MQSMCLVLVNLHYKIMKFDGHSDNSSYSMVIIVVDGQPDRRTKMILESQPNFD